MKHTEFHDPFPSLPALERTIIKLRSYEITLALFYAEEISRQILDMVDSSDKSKAKLDPNFKPRAPAGTKKRFEKALKAMLADDAISSEERQLIVDARNFRNDLAHETDRMFYDIEQTHFTGFKPDSCTRKELGMKEYDHHALAKFQQVFEILDRTMRENYRIGTFCRRGHVIFSSTEMALKQEIKKARLKLGKLSAKRQEDINILNAELNKGFRLLYDLFRAHQHFDIRFFRGPMTKRGQAFCYLLFDASISDLAVAHIFEMRLPSIQKRREKWLDLGGLHRQHVDFTSIPVQRVPSPFDD